jgi:hypothetical protein
MLPGNETCLRDLLGIIDHDNPVVNTGLEAAAYPAFRRRGSVLVQLNPEGIRTRKYPLASPRMDRLSRPV